MCYLQKPLIIWLIIFSSLPDLPGRYDILVSDFRRHFLYGFVSDQLNACLPPSTSVALTQAVVVGQTAISGRDAYSVIREQEGKGTNADLRKCL